MNTNAVDNTCVCCGEIIPRGAAGVPRVRDGNIHDTPEWLEVKDEI